jgi:hypothetical protein
MRAVRALTLIILSCEMSLHCQTTSPPVDIYAGFVGTWIGSADYPYYGVRIKQEVEVHCSETKKKDALRCQYTYGHKGEKHFHQDMHTITLDPIKGTYTSVWGGGLWDAGSNLSYQTVGLDTFAKTGKGVFMAYGYGTKGTPTAVEKGAFGTRRTQVRLQMGYKLRWQEIRNVQHLLLNPSNEQHNSATLGTSLPQIASA